MGLTKLRIILMILISFSFTSCITYSFTGASIPSGVNTIYIPFFPDQSNSGLGDLGDQLNQVLIDRFVNQSRLQLSNTEEDADAILDGTITSYSNRPFSISGDEQTGQNQISISVRASFKYATNEDAEWNKTFNGRATYDPAQNPIDGERTAALSALEQVANNMFNDAVSNW